MAELWISWSSKRESKKKAIDNIHALNFINGNHSLTRRGQTNYAWKIYKRFYYLIWLTLLSCKLSPMDTPNPAVIHQTVLLPHIHTWLRQSIQGRTCFRAVKKRSTLFALNFLNDNQTLNVNLSLTSCLSKKWFLDACYWKHSLRIAQNFV